MQNLTISPDLASYQPGSHWGGDTPLPHGLMVPTLCHNSLLAQQLERSLEKDQFDLVTFLRKILQCLASLLKIKSKILPQVYSVLPDLGLWNQELQGRLH